ncbi:MAG: hypothetical protein AAF600_17510 [Bacteroidota bacterium]
MFNKQFLGLVLSVAFFACQQQPDESVGLDNLSFNEIHMASVSQAIDDFDPFFDDVDYSSARITSDVGILSYDIVADLEKGTTTIINFSFLEDVIPIFDDQNDDPSSGRISGSSKYSVECAYSNGTVTSTSCSSGISCVKIVKKCLDDGSCSTICSVRKLYNPASGSIEDFMERDISLLTRIGLNQSTSDYLQNQQKLRLSLLRSNPSIFMTFTVSRYVYYN